MSTSENKGDYDCKVQISRCGHEWIEHQKIPTLSFSRAKSAMIEHFDRFSDEELEDGRQVTILFIDLKTRKPFCIEGRSYDVSVNDGESIRDALTRHISEAEACWDLAPEDQIAITVSNEAKAPA